MLVETVAMVMLELLQGVRLQEVEAEAEVQTIDILALVHPAQQVQGVEVLEQLMELLEQEPQIKAVAEGVPGMGLDMGQHPLVEVV